MSLIPKIHNKMFLSVYSESKSLFSPAVVPSSRINISLHSGVSKHLGKYDEMVISVAAVLSNCDIDVYHIHIRCFETDCLVSKNP